VLHAISPRAARRPDSPTPNLPSAGNQAAPLIGGPSVGPRRIRISSQSATGQLVRAVLGTLALSQRSGPAAVPRNAKATMASPLIADLLHWTAHAILGGMTLRPGWSQRRPAVCGSAAPTLARLATHGRAECAQPNPIASRRAASMWFGRLITRCPATGDTAPGERNPHIPSARPVRCGLRGLRGG
jgi:hypothetical protein